MLAKGKRKGKREGLIPPQPGALVGGLRVESAHFSVSLQEAFAGHHLGPELCVTKWNTPLLRLLNSSPIQ